MEKINMALYTQNYTSCFFSSGGKCLYFTVFQSVWCVFKLQISTEATFHDRNAHTELTCQRVNMGLLIYSSYSLSWTPYIASKKTRMISEEPRTIHRFLQSVIRKKSPARIGKHSAILISIIAQYIALWSTPTSSMPIQKKIDIKKTLNSLFSLFIWHKYESSTCQNLPRSTRFNWLKSLWFNI